MLHRRLLPGLALLAASAACRPSAPPVIAALPDFELVAVSAGRPAAPLTKASLQGRPWVAGFVFTRCSGPCPAISAAMARLQQTLPTRVGLVTFTVDPVYDTPAVLSAYAAKFRADPARWLFATGSAKALESLLVAGFKVPTSGSGLAVTHTTRLVLVDAQGRVRGYFDSETASGLRALESAAQSL